MRRTALVLAGAVWLALVTAFTTRAHIEHLLTRALDPSAEPRLLDVPQGSSSSDLLHLMAEQGFAPNGVVWDLYVDHLHASEPVPSGEYLIGAGQSPLQQLRVVESGRRFEYTFTLPAGGTLEEMAEALAAAGVAEAGPFLEAARDVELLEELGVEGPSAEGFIYPDVWALPRGLEPAELLTRLVERFFDRAPDLASSAEVLGLTPHQLVTVASLVERGPVPPEEWRLYAALLIERLQKGYALESAAADEYGRTRPGAPADPRQDPWNTTQRPGLPSTPIGSPSLSALRATAAPADTEPVYMVRREGGRHVFCPTAVCYLEALRQHAPGQAAHFPRRFGHGASR